MPTRVPWRARSRALLAPLLALALVASSCSSSSESPIEASGSGTTDDSGSDDAATGDKGAGSEGPSAVALPDGALLEQVELGDVTVHAYLGVTALNGNYVIESENAVVVVDSSFRDPDPATLWALADATEKPIERVLITHGHPDHVGGLADAFADVPIATTATVAAGLDLGDREIEILDGRSVSTVSTTSRPSTWMQKTSHRW